MPEIKLNNEIKILIIFYKLNKKFQNFIISVFLEIAYNSWGKTAYLW